jgi:hypothetical protein
MTLHRFGSAIALLFATIVPLYGRNSGPVTASVVSASAHGRIPLYFEENVGQTADSVRFLARGAGYALFIRDMETVAVLSSRRPGLGASLKSPEGIEEHQRNGQRSVLRMRLVGGNERPAVPARCAGVRW